MRRTSYVTVQATSDSRPRASADLGVRSASRMPRASAAGRAASGAQRHSSGDVADTGATRRCSGMEWSTVAPLWTERE